MKTIVMCLLFGAVLLTVSGCKSLTNASMTEEMVKRQAVTEQVLRDLASKGNTVVADFLANVPESGAVGWTKIERAIRDTAGNPVVNPDGTVALEKGEAIGKSNSMRELGNVEEAYFVLGGLAYNPKTGEVESSGAPVDGMRVYVRGVQMTTTLSEEFAQVWATKTVEEKKATADALKAEYEGRKGLIVEGMTAAGEVAKGILKEVIKVTPYGAGIAVVDAVIEVAGKGNTPVTIAEPLSIEKISK